MRNPRKAWRTLTAVALVTVSVVGGVAAPAHAATNYTALGDSYSSGVGTREYYADSGGCQRSPRAYPVVDAGRIGATLTFVACAGATTTGIMNGQLGGLNAATNYVTVTAGGNDLNWTQVIIQCAKPWPYTCWGDIDRAENFMRNNLPGLLDQLYSAIKAKAPNARIIAVGYPRLFNGEECNVIARISPGEQARLNSAADLLATTIQGRAAANGIVFVDARPAYNGHAVCDDVEWINGTSWPIGESYHPNRSGQTGYAGIVEAALRG
ncbi:MAG TPA: SGNH/GDSL hydrolase family protein [Candidatus Limnocylindrales bacterium]|nr:SGNH/GDSL hydrolase family protein [Candidatus Limnocylindrales bacterium]